MTLCPFRKEIIEVPAYSYNCAKKVENFGECYYEKCPFYDSSSDKCKRVKSENEENKHG